MPISSIFSGLTGSDIAGWGIAVVVALLTLVQISPIRLNPWNTLFAWVGKKVNSAQVKQLELLEKQVTSLWVNDHRYRILTFARECRAGIEHSSDEWSNLLCVCDEYEVYVEKKQIANGIVKADTRYLRDLYQELSREHKL